MSDFIDTTKSGLPLAATPLFGDYDRAAEALQEARAILALDPTHKPAQDRVNDALHRVAHEIGRWLEKTRTPAECPGCHGTGYEEIDHGHYPCGRGCKPNKIYRIDTIL